MEHKDILSELRLMDVAGNIHEANEEKSLNELGKRLAPQYEYAGLKLLELGYIYIYKRNGTLKIESAIEPNRMQIDKLKEIGVSTCKNFWELFVEYKF